MALRAKSRWRGRFTLRQLEYRVAVGQAGSTTLAAQRLSLPVSTVIALKKAEVEPMRDPRYDILFEPLAIGPLVAPNRFYQVPHCNGGGFRDPSAAAAMRGVKAEGGWGVIFTEQTEMHHTSEITPFIELRLWEDKDIPSIAKMAAAMTTLTALAFWVGWTMLNLEEEPEEPSARPS